MRGADLEGNRWTFVQARPTMRLDGGPIETLATAVQDGAENLARSLIGKVDRRAAGLLLHRFARAGDTGALQDLLGLGAEVNTVDEAGATAVHFAAGGGHRDCVLALIEAGADLDRRDAEHASSPVLWAREFGHRDVVELLLAHGARLNAADAAKLGLNGVVAGFLDDVPETLNRATGWPTPLAGAVTGGHPDTVQLLLERGADPNAPTGSGDRPLDTLRWVDEGREPIEELLRRHGAR